MKTDKDVMAAVLRKMAENVENGKNAINGIQWKAADWCDATMDGNYFYMLGDYRVRPETIQLDIDIEIPKPLSNKELGKLESGKVYRPCLLSNKCSVTYAHHAMIDELNLCYKTKEEALAVSAILSGLGRVE